MMRIFLWATLIALAATAAHAQSQVDLKFVADGDSRFFELLAGAWSQIDTPYPAGGAFEDGYFSIEREPGYQDDYDADAFDPASFEPTVYYQIGDGTPDVFPNERHFQGDYRIVYDSSQLTGVGRESAPLLSADLDFYADFAHGDMLGVDGYLTEDELAEGEVHFIDGQVAGFDATISCKFTYDLSVWGFPEKTSFNGTLALDGRRWTLLGDGSYETGLTPLRNVWDGHGYLDDLYESGLPGDYDNNGAVDGNDFLVWQQHVGDPHHTLPNDPDNVDEEPISTLQLAAWAAHFGQTLPENAVVSSPVPEPQTTWLAAFAVVGITLRFPKHLRSSRVLVTNAVYCWLSGSEV